MRSKRQSEDPEATQIVISRRLEAVEAEQKAVDEPEPLAEETQDVRPEVELRETEEVVSSKRRLRVVLYSVGLALSATLGLALLIAYAWYLQPGQALTALSADLQRYALLNTLLTMLIAGVAGGALSNLREFLRLGQSQEGLPARLEVPLYLRPVSAGVMGVLVFFLLQFFVAVLSVGGTTQGWALLHGRLAYVAVALVIGFGVRDLERVRDIAVSLVARRD